ncbi:MAG: trimethylamine methyltransferase family protein, partial [Actinobacteria bacterium]|nr:trimethylamine methyltransferase family protein [Actinomycetota bacterium]
PTAEDDEINGIIRRLYRGIDVSADTIAAEVINSVGPRGNFFIEDHTFNYLRSGEFREVKVSNTKTYDGWLSAGAPDVVKTAGKKVKEIISAGNDNKLESKKIKGLEQIIKEFESNLGIG